LTFQCNILAEDQFTLQVEDSEKNTFVTHTQLLETLKDMAELTSMYKWCGWETQSMDICKTSVLGPTWMIALRVQNSDFGGLHKWGTKKPFQMDLTHECSNKQSEEHSCVRLDFATFEEAQTALTVIIHILEAEGSATIARIRKSFSRHLTGKKQRARNRRAAVAADEARQQAKETKKELNQPKSVFVRGHDYQNVKDLFFGNQEFLDACYQQKKQQAEE
jgi:hypothetical protein